MEDTALKLGQKNELGFSTEYGIFSEMATNRGRCEKTLSELGYQVGTDFQTSTPIYLVPAHALREVSRVPKVRDGQIRERYPYWQSGV